MTQNTDQVTATIAANLAAQTASKAADLATAAAATATTLATKQAETTAVISNDITWMKGSLTGIENAIKEIKGSFTNKSDFVEVVKVQDDHSLRIKKIENDILVAKTNVGAFRIVGGAIGGGIVFLLTQFPSMLKSWGIIK